MKSPQRPTSAKRTKQRTKRPAEATSTPRRSRTTVAAVNATIATEIAPAVAIAALEQSAQASGAPAPALEVLAAGATASEIDGNVRVQLLFENGAVLPVEMSAAAGAALVEGLSSELP